MTTFDKREEGFEKKFAHDEELKFKAMARRNKLLGLWAAAELGKSAEEAEAYAKEVVVADFDEPATMTWCARLWRISPAKGVTEASGPRQDGGTAGGSRQANSDRHLEHHPVMQTSNSHSPVSIEETARWYRRQAVSHRLDVVAFPELDEVARAVS